MLIELTDHLRCLEPHEEGYLVLLTGQMVGRRVVTGHLGCPDCGKEVMIRKGVVEFAGAEAGAVGTQLSPEGALAFLGLGGPGGWIALVGAAGSLASGLATLLPGVSIAAVNPPEGSESHEAVSVIHAPRLPLRGGSVRGVVLGADLAGRGEWVSDAARAVLPGLRIVVEALRPADPPAGIEVLASSPICWVGERRRG
ncbi:MAG: hypothetical protein ACRENB_06740 [Gemmatimonadales bacterium]